MRRRACKVTSYLIDVLLVALLDLVAEQRLERPIAKSLGVTRRMVRDDIRHQRACESFGAQGRVASEERIDWATLTGIRLRRRDAPAQAPLWERTRTDAIPAAELAAPRTRRCAGL